MKHMHVNITLKAKKRCEDCLLVSNNFTSEVIGNIELSSDCKFIDTHTHSIEFTDINDLRTKLALLLMRLNSNGEFMFTVKSVKDVFSRLEDYVDKFNS